MRESAEPAVGTASAQRAEACVAAANSATAQVHLRAWAMIMDASVCRWRGRRIRRQYFRLGSELEDLETQRIPTARAGILRRLRIGVLNRGDPVCSALLGGAALSFRLHVAHLSQVRQSAGPLEKAHRFHLDADGASVLVHIQGRAGIVGIPERVPDLITLRCVEGSA